MYLSDKDRALVQSVLAEVKRETRGMSAEERKAWSTRRRLKSQTEIVDILRESVNLQSALTKALESENSSQDDVAAMRRMLDKAERKLAEGVVELEKLQAEVLALPEA